MTVTHIPASLLYTFLHAYAHMPHAYIHKPIHAAKMHACTDIHIHKCIQAAEMHACTDIHVHKCIQAAKNFNSLSAQVDKGDFKAVKSWITSSWR